MQASSRVAARLSLQRSAAAPVAGTQTYRGHVVGKAADDALYELGLRAQHRLRSAPLLITIVVVGQVRQMLQHVHLDARHRRATEACVYVWRDANGDYRYMVTAAAAAPTLSSALLLFSASRCALSTFFVGLPPPSHRQPPSCFASGPAEVCVWGGRGLQV